MSSTHCATAQIRREHLPSKACSTFTASLALVSKYGIPPFDWQKVIARFEEIMRLFSSTSILFPRTTLNYISPRLLLRSNSTHKRKVFRISWASLYQELVSPAIQGIEALRIIDIVHEYAAVGSSIERDTQRLESFLTCCVPELVDFSWGSKPS